MSGKTARQIRKGLNAMEKRLEQRKSEIAEDLAR